MRLPNASRAFIDQRKLAEYCLDPDHVRGKHKARVFRSALGLGPGDAEKLEDFIRAAAVREDAAPEDADEYGQLFIQEGELTLSGASARVRIVWIVRREEDFPRLVSCYIVNA